jgi:hypothetical protein
VGRQFRPALHPIEQPLAQLVFQLLNLLAERRLGNVAFFGGAGEIARARHRHHVTKLVHFHRQRLS